LIRRFSTRINDRRLPPSLHRLASTVWRYRKPVWRNSLVRPVSVRARKAFVPCTFTGDYLR